MNTFVNRHWKTLLTGVIGLLVFAALNLLMLQTNYELWTNPRMGFYSAFHNGYHFSGFDGHAYIIISKWRSLYDLYRHPLLALFLWPLAETNSWLMAETDTNCAIHIVAVLWTLISTSSWILLHKLINRVVGLGYFPSLLLCFLYFGFAYVMMATFVPDHMILSMTIMLLTLWLACKADMEGKPQKTWHTLLLTFLAMGVSTTNCAKIWLIDMASRLRRTSIKSAFLHSLLYFIPVLFVAGIYIWQEQTTKAEDEAFSKRMERSRALKDQRYQKEARQKLEKSRKTEDKQVSDSKLFKWTDATVDRIPTLYENVFGEGLILHEDHLLEDVNTVNARPVFVPYNHWCYYAIEGFIVMMFAAGVWFSRKERLMWMLLSLMLFDALLHLGFRFAITDIYIMTAHWAFIIPIAIAYLIKRFSKVRYATIGITSALALIAIFLWWHNVSLIASHILG